MITIDFETRSYADLQQVGAWVYSEHPTTEVICCCYSIEDEPIQSWIPEQGGMPSDLQQAIEDGMPVEAHNVSFERSIWVNVLEPEYGWMLPEDRQWRDTMAVASYYALPAALDKLCRVLRMEGKDPEGGRLITRYSKLYLKTAHPDIPSEDLRKFIDYCKQDVSLEQRVSDLLGDLPPEELEVFFLDQEINMRGLCLDVTSIHHAMAIVEQRAEELKKEFKKITGVSPSQNDKARLWFVEHGCPMENLQADYIQDVLEGNQSFHPKGLVRRALEVRAKFNKASTKKLAAMIRNRGKDGRARFQTRYHGAAPGRWTGTGFQPLNLSKGFEHVSPEQLVTDISYRDPEWLDVIYGDAMEAVGKASRHHIITEEGSRLIAGDFVSIEAVLLACLAGEEWKIEAFRRKDPIYELMGCEIHKLGEESEALARADKNAFKAKFPGERFDGKTGELAFGYQGALGAWRKFDSSDRHTDERVIEICKAWRSKHPATVQFWRDLERAAIRTVAKNVTSRVGKLEFNLVDEWLAITLPNGKRIWYWDPQLRMHMPQWHKPGEDEDCANGSCDCKPRRQLTYMAQKEGQWRRVTTYGGKLAENVTQATSREVLVPAMLRLRDAGYSIILSVYDEIVSEVPNDFGSVEEYAEIMKEVPAWAYDDYGQPWPINVDVWEGDRYKK